MEGFKKGIQKGNSVEELKMLTENGEVGSGKWAPIESIEQVAKGND